MAAKDFLRIVAGRITQVFGIQTSSGAGDGGKIPALDDTGRFDISMMPIGVTAEVKTCLASENLAAGDLVNLWLTGGVLKARKADATTAGKEPDGFTLAAITSGNTATIYGPSNLNTSVSGLTIGTRYYLDTTAGGVTATAPSASGNIVILVGWATAATELMFAPGDPITLA